MKTISSGLLLLPVLLAFHGCNSTPTPTPTTAPAPIVQPNAAQVEAIKKYDDKLKKDVAAKKKQRHISDVDTTHAYRNYIP